MDNLISLHRDLKSKVYQHGPYQAFNISDPKPRNIHKASVRDRLLHHAVHRILYPYFDQRFIHDSYSCRIGKGTHKALDQFANYSRKVSKNNTKQCWILKCDIRKFFASIDHQTLKEILIKHLDPDTLWLLSQIINSFKLVDVAGRRVGLPLGNLTSQLLVNIYMNEFDQYAKHKLKVKYYIRYADDFIMFSRDKTYLHRIHRLIDVFLNNQLKLELHPNKIHIRTLSSGVDFLGWIHFPNYRVLRISTKRRMMKNLETKFPSEETRASYLGLLKWGNTHKIRQAIAKVGFNVVD